MPKITPVTPRVISKVCDINISEFKNYAVKQIEVPKDAKTFDIVKVINKFGKKMDIVSFKDNKKENGMYRLIRRYFIEQNSSSPAKIIRNYIYKNPETFNIHEIFRRKIFQTKFVGKTEVSQIEETQAVIKNRKNKELYIKKIVSDNCLPGFNSETQSLYHYQNGQARKGYEIGPYIRTKNVYMTDLTPFSYHFENFNPEKIEIFKKDIYFPLHLYTFKEFKEIAPSVASHPQHKLRYPCQPVWTDSLPENCYGQTNVKNDGGNCIQAAQQTILLNNKLNTNRYFVIETSAHENEHAYEYEQIHHQQMLDRAQKKYADNPTENNLQQIEIIKQFFPVDNPEKAKKFLNEFKKYNLSNLNDTTSETHKIEERALLAEKAAMKEYITSMLNIKQEFPNAPDDFIGTSSLEYFSYYLQKQCLI